MRSNQQGAALVVGLIMLLLLTIIGLSAMQGTTMQEKMSGNMKDSAVALQAGEAALRYAEKGFLESRNNFDRGETFASCNSGCEIVNSEGDTSASNALNSNSPDWDAAALSYGAFEDESGTTIQIPSGSKIDTSNTSSVVSTTPEILIEYTGVDPDDLEPGAVKGVDLYRATVKAAGSSPDSQVILQTIYGRRFN